MPADARLGCLGAGRSVMSGSGRIVWPSASATRTPGDGRDDQLCLDHRELAPDAPARAAAERDGREARPRRFALGHEAPGSKRSGSGHRFARRCTTNGSRTRASPSGRDSRQSRLRRPPVVKAPRRRVEAQRFPRSRAASRSAARDARTTAARRRARDPLRPRWLARRRGAARAGTSTTARARSSVPRQQHRHHFVASCWSVMPAPVSRRAPRGTSRAGPFVASVRSAAGPR